MGPIKPFARILSSVRREFPVGARKLAGHSN